MACNMTGVLGLFRSMKLLEPSFELKSNPRHSNWSTLFRPGQTNILQHDMNSHDEGSPEIEIVSYKERT